jgi:hypothetical protein
METDQLRRAVLGVGLLVVLAVLFVWAGTIQPDPSNHRYPDTSDIYDDPEAYIGEKVTLYGTVTQTAPLTVEGSVQSGGTLVVTVENVAADVSNGEKVWVHGTLRPNNRVEAINTVQRERREAQYMYVISFLAGLVVLGRLLNDWTLDTTDWSIVPRTNRVVEFSE